MPDRACREGLFPSASFRRVHESHYLHAQAVAFLLPATSALEHPSSSLCPIPAQPIAAPIQKRSEYAWTHISQPPETRNSNTLFKPDYGQGDQDHRRKARSQPLLAKPPMIARSLVKRTSGVTTAKGSWRAEHHLAQHQQLGRATFTIKVPRRSRPDTSQGCRVSIRRSQLRQA